MNTKRGQSRHRCMLCGQPRTWGHPCENWPDLDHKQRMTQRVVIDRQKPVVVPTQGAWITIPPSMWPTVAAVVAVAAVLFAGLYAVRALSEMRMEREQQQNNVAIG